MKGKIMTKPQNLLLRKPVSFSGSSSAIHMRNGSSNLTGIMSSLWQGEKDNALKLQSRNKRRHCYEARRLSCNLFCVFNILRCTFSQVKHQRLSVVCSHVSKMGFDLGFYVALQSLPAPNQSDAVFTLAAFLLLLSTQSLH